MVQDLEEEDKNHIGEKRGNLKLIIPVRCFTCGSLIGDKWEEFSKRVKEGENPRKVLDDLGIKRYCCRRMLISHVETMDELLEYFQKKPKTSEKK